MVRNPLHGVESILSEVGGETNHENPLHGVERPLELSTPYVYEGTTNPLHGVERSERR